MSDRINVVIRGAGVLVVAGVLATGAYVVNDGGEPATANAFVGATAQTCTRSSTPITYEEAEANGWVCGTFDAAYDVANASADASTVLVKGGSYGEQQITGNRTSSNRITFGEVTGETVTLTGMLRFGLCSAGVYELNPSHGPDYITMSDISTGLVGGNGSNRYGGQACHGTSNLTLERMELGAMDYYAASEANRGGGR